MSQNATLLTSLTSQPNLTSPTLVIFCKRPKLHQGKQRLVQNIPPEQTLTIAKGLLACAIEDSLDWQGPVVIACSDENDIQWAQYLNPKAHIVAQLPSGKTGNLGQRLNYVDKTLRDIGHQHIIVIGTDAPILNHQHYQDVTQSLNKHDIVLSHADDGGVVIMANSQPWPNITNLPWSTDKLSLALTHACEQKGLSIGNAIPGYDVDHVADIKRLKHDLQNDTRPARKALLCIIKSLFNLNSDKKCQAHENSH